MALTIEIEDPNVEVVYWDTYAGSENDCPCSENPPSKSCNFNMRKPANCIAWLKDTSKINVKITSLEEGKTDTTFNSETKNCQECSFLVSTGTQFSIKPIAPEGMEFWYWGSTDYCPCEENKFKSECTFTADYTQLESLSSDIECYVAYKETMVS